MSGNEVLRQFLTIRKNSYKYAPAFQRLHSFVNGTATTPSISALRKEHRKKVGINVVLGEKSDLGLCQLADTMSGRLKLSNVGVSVKPAKSNNVYYGHLAANRNRFAVPSELKYTESTYSSRNIYIWLWTDLQQECPDLYTQAFIGSTDNCNVFTFGHVNNARGGVKHVGGVEEFTGWLDGTTNIFSKVPKLETRGANVYVMFSDNFLEMYPTNHQQVFSQIEEVLGNKSFVRFSYLSRHPISYNALNSYAFPPVTSMIGPQNNYNINVLANVQRQDYAENEAKGKHNVRMMCHSSLFRADQPMNEIIIAQKTPAEDNADLAYLDKFQDYKTAINPIFISEFSDKLQLMHPHHLLTYMFGLFAWPQALARALPLTSIPAANYTRAFKAAHTDLLGACMTAFDTDPSRQAILRSLAFGRPELIEDLRHQLWQYTIVPGTAFNMVKAKALLQRLNSSPEHAPDGPYYEFAGAARAPADASPLAASVARVARASDSIFAIDCEFVRHSMPLRGHINEVNRKQHLSWCKLAPEAA